MSRHKWTSEELEALAEEVCRRAAELDASAARAASADKPVFAQPNVIQFPIERARAPQRTA